MQILTVKIVFSILNATRKDGEKEIKPIKIVERPAKKTKAQIEAEKRAKKQEEEWNTLMRNLDAYDGTGIGQEDIK